MKGDCYCWWPFHGKRTPCGTCVMRGCLPSLPHSALLALLLSHVLQMGWAGDHHTASQWQSWSLIYSPNLESLTYHRPWARCWRCSVGQDTPLPPRSSACGVRQTCDKQLWSRVIPQTRWMQCWFQYPCEPLKRLAFLLFLQQPYWDIIHIP